MKRPCATQFCLGVITVATSVMCSYFLTGGRSGAAPPGCVQRVRAGTGFSGLDNFYQEEKDTTAAPNPKGQTKQTLTWVSDFLRGDHLSQPTRLRACQRN